MFSYTIFIFEKVDGAKFEALFKVKLQLNKWKNYAVLDIFYSNQNI